MTPLSGPETIAAVRAKQQDTILAFSSGKDSIAAWLELRESFENVYPFYLYGVPDLEFVDESLDYYERFFHTKILRYPHPSLHRKLRNFVFQPPENCLVIEQAMRMRMLPKFEYEDVRQSVVDKFDLPEETLYADGVRAADSPIRRLSILKHGSITWSQHKYHPVWDWKKADLVACLQKYGVKLPVDYKLFGRTFDGVDLRFLLPLKKHRPKDYKKVLDFFPLADLEIFRWEKANA